VLGGAVILLAACAWVSDADVSRLRDGDGDGIPAWEDCDDADEAAGGPQERFPDDDHDGFGDAAGAAEVCARDGWVTDGTDCDDDDASVGGPQMRYPDRDGDGYGDADDGSLACPAAGLVDAGDDCDDTDASVGPAQTRWPDEDGDGFGEADGAAEVCPGEPGWVDNDDDCDDTYAYTTGPTTFYTDADGDGFGDPDGETVTDCDSPDGGTGWAWNGDDCDDGRADVNPDVFEVPDATVDYDCDGLTGDWSLPWAGPGWQANTGGGNPQLGWALAFGPDVDGDGKDDLVFGIPRSNMVMVVPVEEYSGPPYAIAPTADLPTRIYGTHAVEDRGAGESVAIADITGDGHADLIFGEPYGDSEEDASPDAGNILIAEGPVPQAASGYTFAIWGASGGDNNGAALIVADVDGDDAVDLFMGAPGAGEGKGAVRLLHGPVEEQTQAAAASELYLDRVGDDAPGVGRALAVGNFDGENLDIALGAPGTQSGAEDGGAVWVCDDDAQPSGKLDESPDCVELLGELRGAEAGTAIAAGDVTGDGYDDLLIGAPGADGEEADAGAVWVIAGPFGGGSIEELAMATISGEADDAPGGERLGAGLATVNWVSDDGMDLAIGAPGWGDATQDDLGAVYYLTGPITPGDWPIAWAHDRYGCPFHPCGAGTVLVGADVDADGWGDVLVGLPDAMDSATFGGAAFALLGINVW
jgi:hypothetical protein